MNKFILFLSFSCCCFQSTGADADYYLKFKTSGATVPVGPVTLSNDRWIDVSITDTHPTDGPIHYKGSETGAWPSYSYSGRIKLFGDDVNFYVAEVPRSITVIDKSNGAKIIITSGEPATRFDNGAAFLLPDSLLIAPGVSRSTSVYKIYIAATMPAKVLPGVYQPYSSFHTAHIRDHGMDTYCVQGWSQGPINADSVTMWQIASLSNETCKSTLMFYGTITHIIRER